MHIGFYIKMARMAKNLTQEDLAEKIHKTRPLVSHIEQTGKVSSNTLKTIARVLEIDLDQLQREVHEPPLTYLTNTKATSQQVKKLEEQIRYLQSEVDTLQRLVKSQEEIIELLREKRSGKK